MDRPPSKDMIKLAEEAARMSPCVKSKRGVVAFADRTPYAGAPSEAYLGRGYNGPPPRVTCLQTQECMDTCAKRCVHAESRAIREALRFKQDRDVVSLLHVKINSEGVCVPGGPPSCWQCSRELLDVGFDGIWLCELSEGWVYYKAKEFHEITSRNCGVAYGAV